MKRKIENPRFEFVLYINKHIICSRQFKIRNYNEAVIDSIELKELMDNLIGINNGSGIIPSYLKKESMKLLWGNYNPFNKPTVKTGKNNFKNEDWFSLVIKVDNSIIAQKQFSSNWFPPNIRYQVNIIDVIPTIIDEIQYYLSKEEYTTTLMYR
jgi:xylose isomerase